VPARVTGGYNAPWNAPRLMIADDRDPVCCRPMNLSCSAFVTVCLISGVVLLSAEQSTGGSTPSQGIALDGRVDETEWKAASSQPLEGGGTVHLMFGDRLLYVGIRGPAAGTAHVCVGSSDEVRILHVSAAVGSALYRQSGGAWTLQSPFSWSLRETALTGAPAEARTAYLKKEGWVGTVSRMGRETDRELIIDRNRFRSPLRLAVAYVTTGSSGTGSVSRWPDLRDNCSDQRTVAGLLPNTAKFLVNDWALVR
jgi:hypothetical protein